MTFDPKTVLVYVGGDLVGDAVMKLPFVRALRHIWPHAHITWYAGKYRSAFAHELSPLVVGLIDEVIEDTGLGRSIFKLFRRPVAERFFDLVIDTQRGGGTTFLVRRIRHKAFVSGTANFLFSSIKPPSAYRRPNSMIAQMLDLLTLAAGHPTVPHSKLNINADDKSAAKQALPEGQSYVGLAPGAGGRHKCWPLENFIALANRQIEMGRCPVFILGPEEGDLYKLLRQREVRALFPTVRGATKPNPSVTFSIALAQRLSIAVANDSGTGHILAAADIPLVSLFGPTPAEKFAPTTNKLEIIRAKEFGAEEMAAIPVESVVAAMNRLITAN